MLAEFSGLKSKRKDIPANHPVGDLLVEPRLGVQRPPAFVSESWLLTTTGSHSFSSGPSASELMALVLR